MILLNFVMSLSVAMQFSTDFRTSLIDSLCKHYLIFSSQLSEVFIVPRNITLTHVAIVVANIFIFYVVLAWLPSAYVMEYHRLLQSYVETAKTKRISYSLKACKTSSYIRVQTILVQLETVG